MTTNGRSRRTSPGAGAGPAARLVGWCARHPWPVLAAAVVAAAGSALAQRALPRDAIPDLSEPQIVVVADWMGHPATEVSERVTRVLSAALEGLPGSTTVRGSSMTGMAYLDVGFGSVAALADGRREMVARLDAVRPRLPAGTRVQVGPEASSTGWVFQYALLPADMGHAMPMMEEQHSLAKKLLPLLQFQDEVLRPALSAVPGVAEVATIGGISDEVRIQTTADQLRGAGAALSDLVGAVRARLDGHPRSTLAELGDVPLPGAAGASFPLSRVAEVRRVPGMAAGMANVDGLASTVGGIVIARRDADPTAVIERVRQVIEAHRHHLPAGAKLGVVYDRSELAGRIEGTLHRALAEEVAVVALVVLLFLLHARSALVPMATLPLVVLLTFAAMRLLGVPATIMSLGGIAIALGMAVDADLVALEACHRRLEADRAAGGGGGARDRRRGLVEAAGSFAPAILTSLVIAALAFVPVFAFGGESGRLLRPLAITKTLVIAAAALVALTVAPALRDRLLGGRVIPELGNPLTRGLVRIYRPFVGFALRRPALTLVTAGLAVLSCLPLLPRLGSEFLPRIDEGELLYMPTTAPGLSPTEAMEELDRQDAVIASHPEVALVFGKIGRADTATDPAPLSMAETTIRLRPRAQWPKVAHRRWYSGWAPRPLARALGRVWPEETPATTAELVEALDRATRFPGWANAWTAPARARMDMMATGVRTPVGVRIVAADPARLERLGAAVRAAVAAVPGTRSAAFESLGGEARAVYALDAGALARHHVDGARAAAVADLLIAGGQVGELASEAGRPLRVRVTLDAPWLPKPLDDLLRDATVRSDARAAEGIRGDQKGLEGIRAESDPRDLISSPRLAGRGLGRGAGDGGQPVPLALLGRPVFASVPSMLRAERGEPVAYVYVDVADGTDLGGYVARAREAVDQALRAGALRLEAGERIEWTGQYELMAAGQRRLMVIAPLVALCMLGLLFLQFRSWTEALIVLVSVPFALVGSFWTLYLLGYRLSAPVWVGLLSVVGLAMQTGVVMVVYIDEAFRRRVAGRATWTREDIIEAHAEGTVRRLRPKVMTIATMAAGLMPLLWANGAGAEIMKRVAAPMIGGLVTSAFLTLEVIPVLYTIWRIRQLEAARPVAGRAIQLVTAGRSEGRAAEAAGDARAAGDGHPDGGAVGDGGRHGDGEAGRIAEGGARGQRGVGEVPGRVGPHVQ